MNFSYMFRKAMIKPQNDRNAEDAIFSGDFQGQEGVCIMHQCTLCNPNDGNYILTIYRYGINDVKIITIQWFNKKNHLSV